MELISFVASSFTVGFAYFSLQQWIPALVAVVSTTNAVIDAEDMDLRRDSFRMGRANLEAIKREFKGLSSDFQASSEKRAELVQRTEQVALSTQRRVLGAADHAHEDTNDGAPDHVATQMPKSSSTSQNSNVGMQERRIAPANQLNVGTPRP